ncbi:EAL domain-containing protein [Spongisporangium articulatum]|uniref:EAL domain-containing protein n=1 Tax=Spongisporangium articulatum TaxID=3362603 RepID=A0ABW8AMW2_9ACTN
MSRTQAETQVAELLRTARRALGLSLAFLSRLDEQHQHIQVMESALPVFRDGHVAPRETSLCQYILDEKLPPVIPDLRAHPEVMSLPGPRWAHLRSYVSVPVTLSDGTLWGTFCAAGLKPHKKLAEKDRALLEVLAHAASIVIERDVVETARLQEIRSRLEPLIAAGGPVVVLQPIVDLADGRRVGAEALSRFPPAWDRTPDVVFAEAHEVGLGHGLERMALASAMRYLDGLTGYLAMNVSPRTLVTPECLALLAEAPLDRVVLELTEHEAVEDYDTLRAALGGLRGQAARLAIDDVGSGFSSLRHIVLTAPDVIKLDRTIVAGVHADPVLQALVSSMVRFGHDSGAKVVAEGVETRQDADALATLGVDYGQGWFFGAPVAPDQLAPARKMLGEERPRDATLRT